MYNALTRVEAYSLSPCLLVTGDIGALAGAPIQELNLSNCRKLTGTSTSRVRLKHRCCPKATHNGTFLGMFFLSPLTGSTSPPTTLGSIEVFQGMPIEKLDLYRCEKLTGEWVEILLLKISAIMLAGCCPRATPM